ncbi:TetR/AcrR family transcriptional regulator [Gordonia sp. PP30]|uniref:TetR/AcrR family transcriptional regulator n=1 Tax=unclassified Gordonia (in: high G+C Gram-positive bacteria) TaxID=2657482 RepID=UPI001FFED130|nr:MULTISPECIES: TetR/AcrR family transcriptional regulator [unclassified Gordonia (in: high G+C Gram-positive bacteria)]UQE73421.1 TetR/AcrR family transcriptional regulator [Gordonia sp. PP30]
MGEAMQAAGRPRSEQARLAVLRAVDDMLVEHGYAAMTMKGIAERAGVGRQTVYRWWSSKAEILLEASAADAARELAVVPQADPVAEVAAFLAGLSAFLTSSDAGLAYRALLGEAQHDATVARLLRGSDILGDAARAVVGRLIARGTLSGDPEALAAELVGPTLYRILADGEPVDDAESRRMAGRFLR